MTTGDATFEEVFDWLVDHEGKRVTVEVGCRDPRSEQLADLAVVQVVTTLGRVRRVEELETGHGVLRVPFGDKDSEHGGIEIDHARITSATIRTSATGMTTHLKVWQFDMYALIAPPSTPL
jgi:hypothetical protein